MFGLHPSPRERVTPVFRRTNNRRPVRKLFLEELERRETPAPVGPALSGVPGPLGSPLPPTGQSPALTNNPNSLPSQQQAATSVPFTPLNGSVSPGFPVEGAANFVNQVGPGVQASPLAATGSITLGLPTVDAGSANAATYLFSTGRFNVPAGAPDPVRLMPEASLVVQADAPLSAVQPYVYEDINLSGGGGPPSDDHLRPPGEIGDPNHPQTRLEASAFGSSDASPQAPPDVVGAAALLVFVV